MTPREFTELLYGDNAPNRDDFGLASLLTAEQLAEIRAAVDEDYEE